MVEASACTKGSKMRAAASGCTPMPSSSTSRSISRHSDIRSFRRHLILTRPPCETNLIALSNRSSGCQCGKRGGTGLWLLLITCVKRIESPMIASGTLTAISISNRRCLELACRECELKMFQSRSCNNSGIISIAIYIGN